ncbi:MAG: hypothetical protein K2P74_01530 [Nitrosomonas sp.]|nr:hypothetical protein [Nitrosomonas sp.]
MKIFGLKSALIVTTYVFYVNSLAYAQEDIPDRSQKSSIKKFHKDNKRKAGLFFTDSGTSYRWNEDRNEIRLGGFIQADSHTFFNDVSEPGNDSFTLRRIRPVLEIRFGKIYSFYVMPNLESSPGILDAFFEGNYIRPCKLANLYIAGSTVDCIVHTRCFCQLQPGADWPATLLSLQPILNHGGIYNFPTKNQDWNDK